MKNEIKSPLSKPISDLWKKRFSLERAIREQLWAWEFQETRTPLLVVSPGMEPHLCPIEVRNPHGKKTFLPTSPEFAMKKLLALGLPKIFQICSSFRDEPTSPEHHPEFSMLEFYETNCTLEQFQSRVEDLVSSVAMKLHGKTLIPFRGQDVELKSGWPRYRVVDLFLKETGCDLRKNQTSAALAEVCQKHKIIASADESWDDLYFKLWLNLVEPKLPTDTPCFVTHYPVSQSSLCNRVNDETGFAWANRFEFYLGALELGNAFDELRDPSIQRSNFLHDQKIRKDTYGDRYPESPLDEELLAAIPQMKPTCGIAIGVDRLCMILLNAKTIDEVIPLRSQW